MRRWCSGDLYAPSVSRGPAARFVGMLTFFLGTGLLAFGGAFALGP